MVEPNNNFDDIERELREQLAPRPAPLGFATRVLARVGVRERSKAMRMPLWRWIAAAAVLLATVALAGNQWEVHRRRMEGEQARAQVLLALRIAGTTLNAVQQKVQNAENTGTGKETPQ